jgi:hypothetical protein
MFFPTYLFFGVFCFFLKYFRILLLSLEFYLFIRICQIVCLVKLNFPYKFHMIGSQVTFRKKVYSVL